VKFFLDPVYPDSAYLCHHAGGRAEPQGHRYYTQEAINALVLRTHQRGFQLVVHCLGNGAVEQALVAFEGVQRAHRVADPRFRIEHAFVIDREQIARAVDLGVIFSVQPSLQREVGHSFQRRAAHLGRNVVANPIRSLVAEGATVAASSDYPCGPLPPLAGIDAAVWRHPIVGDEALGQTEMVSPQEALRMYTLNAAYALKREREVGSLEVGKRADFVVLSHDPTRLAEGSAMEVTVDETYVDGKLMWKR
jgi:predicted amidohydrolase YtcJ